MSIFLWDSEPNKIYVWDTEVSEVYVWDEKVRPISKYKTFTITWEEKSDMSSWWTYSDDAAWLTAGSTAFDDFFWYSAVKLSSNGTESAIVNQNAGVLDITQLGTLTSGDNVMIKFPRRWIKMSKSWSIITLSITNEPNKVGYQYYAFTRWTTVKDQMYIGAYLGYNSSNVLKSWSWQAPSTNISITNARIYAQANWTGYDQIAFFQKMYISALYMMKYWNPNCQSVVGMWYVYGSAKQNTWNTNSQTSATYWTTSATQQIKLFWLEDRWWNLNQWLDWAYCDGNRKVLVNVTNQNFSSSPTEWVDYVDSGVSFWWDSEALITAVAGTNLWMFLPTSLSWTAYTTYYTDTWAVRSNKVPHIWWYRTDNQMAWIFHFFCNWTSTTTYEWSGSRIMYL